MKFSAKILSSVVFTVALSACGENECEDFPVNLVAPDAIFLQGRPTALSLAEIKKVDGKIKKCYNKLNLDRDYIKISFQSAILSPNGKRYLIYKSTVSSDRFIVFRKGGGEGVDRVFKYNPNEI